MSAEDRIREGIYTDRDFPEVWDDALAALDELVAERDRLRAARIYIIEGRATISYGEKTWQVFPGDYFTFGLVDGEALADETPE